jgi:hypothetical protein
VPADTDTRVVLGIQCTSAEPCPLPRLFGFRREYQAALQRLDQTIEQYNPDFSSEPGRELDMAHFIRRVAENASNPAPGRSPVPGIWGSGGCMRSCYLARSASAGQPPCQTCRSLRGEPSRSCGCRDIAQDYDRSYLYQFINFREQAIRDARVEAESAAENLIEALLDPAMQQHLVDYHSLEFAPTSNVPRNCYGISHWGRGDTDRPELREIDHILACISMRLDAVEPGRQFLNHVIDEPHMDASPDNYAAIKNAWEFFSTTSKATPAIGKFVANVAPVVVKRVRDAIIGNRSMVRDPDPIARALRQREVRAALSFLDEQTGGDDVITGIVTRQARNYGQRTAQFIEQANARRELREAMEEFQDAMEQFEREQPLTIEKLQGSGFQIAFSLISFTLAMAKLAKDWERQNFKDWLSVIGGAAGLADTLSTEIRQSIRRVRGQVGTPLSASAQSAAIGLSMLGMVIQVVTGSMDIAEHVENSRSEEALVAASSLAVGFAGSMAGLVTTFGTGMGVAAATLSVATAVTSVCLVVALVGVIVMFLITDPPLVTYLGKTHWGRNRQYSIASTMDRYYRDLYQDSFSIEFISGGQADPHLQIRSAAMNDLLPVEVTIRPHGRLDSVRILPVRGSGTRSIMTDSGSINWRINCVAHPSGAREIQIFNVDRLFGVPRGGSETYHVEAKMDPDADGEIELTARREVRIR